MIAIFPEIANCAATGDSERLAILARKYFAGKAVHAPKVDVQALLEAAGIIVDRRSVKDHAVLLAKDVNGGFTISAILSELGSEPNDAEDRFTLAHLLGHFLLHVQPLIAKGEWTVSGFRESISPLSRYETGEPYAGEGKNAEQKREWEADAFAAALLLPRGMVARASEKLGTPEKMAVFFGVSVACMRRRLTQLETPEISVQIRPVSTSDTKRAGKGLQRIRDIAKMLER